MPVRARSVLLGVALLSGASSVTGQTPEPSSLPDQLHQEGLNLQARANVVQGSGARALGMGGAFLARADDATAASWNPAGLSYLRLPEVSFVYSGSRIGILDVSALQRKDDRQTGESPDFFAAAYPFDLKGLSGAAQISFQRVISFTTSTHTIEETDFDPASGEATGLSPSEIVSAGGFDVLALGTGVTLATHFRLGATVNRWFHGYHQTLDRDTSRVTPGHTTQESDYRLSAWNANLGAMWSPREELNLGVVYKTGFSGDVTLEKSRQDTPPVPPSLNEATARLSLDLPAAVGVGASWRPRSRLTISTDYTRTFWSKGRIHNFFALPRRVGEEVPPISFTVLPYPTLDPTEPQHDTAQLRGGAEFVLIFGRVKIPLRAGAFSDRQFVQSAGGGAPYFTGLTAGTGIILGPFLFDVAFIHETGTYRARDTTNKVDMDTSVTSRRLIGSVIYRLPRH
jgi:long-chain fatty acid transport protein